MKCVIDEVEDIVLEDAYYDIIRTEKDAAEDNPLELGEAY